MNYLVLLDEDDHMIRVPLEDIGRGPGLGTVYVRVEDDSGNEIVPEHPYHFDVRRPDTLDLNRYVEEPEQLPELPAYLQVEPYQKSKGSRVANDEERNESALQTDLHLPEEFPKACPDCGKPLRLVVFEDSATYRTVALVDSDGTVLPSEQGFPTCCDTEVTLLCPSCGWHTEVDF